VGLSSSCSSVNLSLSLRRRSNNKSRRGRGYNDYDERREQAQRQLELEMKRIELGLPPVAAAADNHRPTSTFHIDATVKLIPKFNDHDLESFLLSFEKIMQLNQSLRTNTPLSYRLT